MGRRSRCLLTPFTPVPYIPDSKVRLGGLGYGRSLFRFHVYAYRPNKPQQLPADCRNRLLLAFAVNAGVIVTHPLCSCLGDTTETLQRLDHCALLQRQLLDHSIDRVLESCDACTDVIDLVQRGAPQGELRVIHPLEELLNLGSISDGAQDLAPSVRVRWTRNVLRSVRRASASVILMAVSLLALLHPAN